MGTQCLLLDELTDTVGDLLPRQVIAALSLWDDPFLRTGHPVVETLALLALQLRKVEQLAGRDLTGVDVILEDRGLDSVAVYQAAILCAQTRGTSSHAGARHVLSSAHRWRRLPDATLLLTGDLAVSARRFGHRIGRPLAPADLQLLEQIDLLYRTVAADDPDRYALVDVAGLSPDQAAETVHQVVTRTMTAFTDRFGDREAARVS